MAVTTEAEPTQELTSWERERSSEELQGFISRKLGNIALDAVSLD